jgi:hypothetical protein
LSLRAPAAHESFTADYADYWMTRIRNHIQMIMTLNGLPRHLRNPEIRAIRGKLLQQEWRHLT